MCLLQFYLKDTKSSNGTFVNNQRLSKGSEESPPKEVFSGDIIQFGVDIVENTKKGFLFLKNHTNMFLTLISLHLSDPRVHRCDGTFVLS